jgi:hypothetical protein
MTEQPLSMTRRHVLGQLYGRCEPITESIPVYIAPLDEHEAPTLAGHVEQSMGVYADAFTFHLPQDVCKALSAGYYSYSLEYEHSDTANSTSQSRIRLTSILLTARQNYTKPIPRGTRVGADEKDREEDSSAAVK